MRVAPADRGAGGCGVARPQRLSAARAHARLSVIGPWTPAFRESDAVAQAARGVVPRIWRFAGQMCPPCAIARRGAPSVDKYAGGAWFALAGALPRRVWVDKYALGVRFVGCLGAVAPRPIVRCSHIWPAEAAGAAESRTTRIFVHVLGLDIAVAWGRAHGCAGFLGQRPNAEAPVGRGAGGRCAVGVLCGANRTFYRKNSTVSRIKTGMRMTHDQPR